MAKFITEAVRTLLFVRKKKETEKVKKWGAANLLSQPLLYCVLMGKYIVQHINSRKLDTVNVVVVSSQLTAKLYNRTTPHNTQHHQQKRIIIPV